MGRFFYPIIVLLAFMGCIGLLSMHRAVRSRLSARIAALILLAGPTALLALIVFSAVALGSNHGVIPGLSRLVVVLIIVLGGPLILGYLVARYVTKPLKQFNDAIASIKQSDYQVELKPTGIREFDRVFLEFNDLIGRLRKEEELRKDLISDTSHELNTPLAAMTSQLTAMQESVLPVTKSRIRMLAQQTGRLSELVAQLNEYTRARSMVTETKEDIHLHKFCIDVRESFNTQLQQQGMRLDIKIAPRYVLLANRHSLERIINNLLQNALRYSGGKTITIAAANKQLTISDNGQGVPSESLPYLFERFYRVDASRSRETGGLGLGLAIVRELVHRQGWQIHAEDNKPGLKVVVTLSD